jgi:hypothetical protein
MKNMGFWGFGAVLFLSLACGQETPPAPVAESYHPLVPGSSWKYQHDDWLEEVTLEADTFNGAPAFMMSDSPNPSDMLRSDSIISLSEGRVLRMTKDEYLLAGAGDPIMQSSVTYGVGFTRFNEDWAEQAVGYKESPEYIRVETPPGGTARPGEERRHTFEVMSLSEEVSTPAGTFDCIVIKRSKDWEAAADGVDLADAETKTFWFARGVGKVQERNDETLSVEVLTEFNIPDSAP